MGNVVAADEDHAGHLGIVLVDALGGGTEDVLSLGLPGRPDQDLVVNRDLVVGVEVLLGVVHLGGEEEADPSQGAGHGAPLVAMRWERAVPGT